MSTHYPRIREHWDDGRMVLREGLSLCFYMKRAHKEVREGVQRALETYLREVGPQALGWYAGEEEYESLDEKGWKHTQQQMNHDRWALVELIDAEMWHHRYKFEYYGRPVGDPELAHEPDTVSTVSFWLPTEFLEEHGPGHVRELAIELATLLPFNSGHAGLSFNGALHLVGVHRLVKRHCFRYPGIDIANPGWHSLKLGTRVRGPHWLTFLGQPVLGELGGAAGLRARLHEPGTTVQELEGNRALVTLGPWPEAGDTEQGQTLPAYRELARVLEPWTYFEQRVRVLNMPLEKSRQWERRFLD